MKNSEEIKDTTPTQVSNFKETTGGAVTAVLKPTKSQLEARKGMSAEEVSSESARYRGKAPTPATSTPAAATPAAATPTNESSNITFAQLSKERKEAVLNAQAEFEHGKGKPIRNNNPGNIMYGDFAKSFGGEPSDTKTKHGTIAAFPTMEAGRAAQEALWNRVPITDANPEKLAYKDMPLDKAISIWAGESAEDESGKLGLQNYKKHIFAAAGGKYNPPEPQIAQTPAATGEQAGPPKPANLAKQEPNKPRTLSDLVFAGINSTFDVLDSIMGPILESINPTNQNQPSSQTPTTSDVQISPDMARNEKMWDTYEKMYLTV